MDISTRAMLVTLTLKAWSSSKLDQSVTDEAIRSNNATPKAGRFTKKLVAKEALADIKKLDSAIRAYHYERTLPWSSEGPRILSTAAFAEYDKEMRSFKDKREIACREFVMAFPDHVKTAQNVLGDMFLEADYPDISEVESKFSMEFAYSPVPTGNDFRVVLSEDVTKQLRKEADARTNDAISAATTSVWQRIHDVVEHMASKLEGYQVQVVDGKTTTRGAFHDTLVSNVADLADILPSLNISNDPKLAEMADNLRQKLASYNPQDLRDHESVRKDVAKDARQILAEIQDSLGDV